MRFGEGDHVQFVHDDSLQIHVGIGTHIDTLSHIGHNGEFYGGHTSEELFDKGGVKIMGAETVSNIVAPCVILDMAKYLNMDSIPAGTVFGKSDIENAAKEAGVSISQGSVVLLHTGWIEHGWGANVNKELFNSGEPGIGMEAGKYLSDSGVVLVAADNWAVEVIPAEPGTTVGFPVHKALLKERGVLLGEMFDLRELVKDGVTQGTISIQVVAIKGAVQSRVNPQVFT
uniref:Cyclase n=1 Tax=Rhodosorus marinus TaxID=101924 RepID=A0A7S0FZX8_9RHOD|mmetsp:Transcript_10594/g.15334  ORF Transcript_10594/g.15334 Transcript_10594/m.15334 type:complete len:229 (+) Transcript_10594:158-844(+)